MLAHDHELADDVAAVRALETLRCELISQGDIQGLSELLTDDYLHVHATGRVDDKAAALASFERLPRRCRRGEMDIRMMGDVALVIGPQINITDRGRGAPEEAVLIVTTVLQRSDIGWRLAFFHGCRQTQPSPP